VPGVQVRLVDDFEPLRREGGGELHSDGVGDIHAVLLSRFGVALL